MVEVVARWGGRGVEGGRWSCLIESWRASGKGERGGKESFRSLLLGERLLTLEARFGDGEELRRVWLAFDRPRKCKQNVKTNPGAFNPTRTAVNARGRVRLRDRIAPL